ncbi:hypothetical protein K435DRAFT_855541 [Dendrothele bispora CBS 962.96]|uniref:Uncharacterized protein n=1 Tax=Dendrothele bispora (strain CBS 962.96) TaxID=1314807 RepID=A0A4S8MAR6_DENBC|nr:hypothetical protein K435DRAFT_855541 [Dendrothele bispora CBS 962.96]
MSRAASKKTKSKGARTKSRGTMKSKSKTTQVACSTEPSPPPNKQPEGNDNSSEEEEGDGHVNSKRKPMSNITKSLINKRQRRVSLPESDLEYFRSAARRFSATYSPYIDWYQVIYAGLEHVDDLIESGHAYLPQDQASLDTLKELYKELASVVPDMASLLEQVVDNGAVDGLITSMNLAASTAISQDIRELKSSILVYAREHLEIEHFSPPIKEDGSKADTRGWHHPQIGRLLCTPIKLPKFLKNPEQFCTLVIEGGIRINHQQFPSCFYQDGGAAALQGKDFVLEHLLRSQLLAKVFVNIYFGKATADDFTDGEPESRFRVKRSGKAYRYNIQEITYRHIAYTSLLLRHSLSASDDWRSDDGAVVKQSAFDAVIALFEIPKLMDEEFNTQLLKEWNEMFGWMLPTGEEARGLSSDDDEDSSLNMIQALVRRKRNAAIANTPSSSKSSGNTTSTGSGHKANHDPNRSCDHMSSRDTSHGDSTNIPPTDNSVDNSAPVAP